MFKQISIIILVLAIGVIFQSSCERIDAGHVGVKVNLYGDNKGVDNITEVTGMVFYNPLTHSIYEFPTFVQHKEYVDENALTVVAKDGSPIKISVMVNYRVQQDKVPAIFAKYRKNLSSIEDGFLKTSIYDAFRIVTNRYPTSELIGNREQYEKDVIKILDSLVNEGFVFEQITFSLNLPESFNKAVELKNNAIQNALAAENRVKEAEAEAKIKLAIAQGEAQSILARARAQSEANDLEARTITPSLLKKWEIEKWNGVRSQIVTGSNGNDLILSIPNK